MYSTLKFIKEKYRPVLTDKHLTELVRTALITYQCNFKKLSGYPEVYEVTKYFVLETRTILKESYASRTSDVRGQRCGHPCPILCLP
jgi:hypothetical protein